VCQSEIELANSHRGVGRYISRARHIASGGATYRHRYVAPPEVVCSAPTDMYHPGPIHNTGRYVAGFALHTETATYRAQTRYIGGATFLTCPASLLVSRSIRSLRTAIACGSARRRGAEESSRGYAPTLQRPTSTHDSQSTHDSSMMPPAPYFGALSVSSSINSTDPSHSLIACLDESISISSNSGRDGQ